MIEIVTPATFEPVTLAELRAQLRIDANDMDGLLASHLRGARATFEADTSMILAAQTLRLTIDAWQDEITIPCAPVSAVSGIEYDSIGGPVSFASYKLRWRNGLARLMPLAGVTWPELADDGQVRITFTAGNQQADELGRVAVLTLAAHLVDAEPGAAFPHAYQEIVSRKRLQWL